MNSPPYHEAKSNDNLFILLLRLNGILTQKLIKMEDKTWLIKKWLLSNIEVSGPHNSLSSCRCLQQRTSLFTAARHKHTNLFMGTMNLMTAIEPTLPLPLLARTETVLNHKWRQSHRHLVIFLKFKILKCFWGILVLFRFESQAAGVTNS